MIVGEASGEGLHYVRRAILTVRPRRARLNDREFWIAQSLMAMATGVVYAAHAFVGDDSLGGGLHDIPIMLFLAPVLYATAIYGFEGAVLTSVLAVGLAAPSSAIYNRDGYEWLGDVGSLTVIVVTSIALAVRVERERRERERAEMASHRLALLNEFGRGTRTRSIRSPAA